MLLRAHAEYASRTRNTIITFYYTFPDYYKNARHSNDLYYLSTMRQPQNLIKNIISLIQITLQ